MEPYHRIQVLIQKEKTINEQKLEEDLRNNRDLLHDCGYGLFAFEETFWDDYSVSHESTEMYSQWRCPNILTRQWDCTTSITADRDVTIEWNLEGERFSQTLKANECMDCFIPLVTLAFTELNYALPDIEGEEQVKLTIRVHIIMTDIREAFARETMYGKIGDQFILCKSGIAALIKEEDVPFDRSEYIKG